MKKVIIGIVGLFIGIIVYFLTKQGTKRHEKTNNHKDHYRSKDVDKKAEGVFKDINSADKDIVDSRAKATSVISERHQEAAKIIKESMDTIFSTDKKMVFTRMS